ncbi:MAG: hypothetical protein ACUVXA_19260 [Candidatus Jordarchaeum sp.]|uniref:hypothetical protein n=1 Tax=Candidatus Jordarchaeum sp. TaxID=2823881 RepID=UPI00404A48C5
MSLVEKYVRYREASKKLFDKIMKRTLSKKALNESGKLLGILQGDTFIFLNENDTDVLMDFALNEYKSNNKNAIEIYRKRIGGENNVEKEILDALLSSYTSLFKVVSVSASESTLVLNDLLNEKENINIIDINFSRTAVPNLLIFIRLIPFKDFNMTSGISLVFPASTKDFFLKRYKRLSERAKSDVNLPMKRFLFFYNWNKTKGFRVMHA